MGILYLLINRQKATKSRLPIGKGKVYFWDTICFSAYTLLGIICHPTFIRVFEQKAGHPYIVDIGSFERNDSFLYFQRDPDSKSIPLFKYHIFLNRKKQVHNEKCKTLQNSRFLKDFETQDFLFRLQYSSAIRLNYIFYG